ncbi:MAG: PAS domain-containing protein [Helicobacteraceae bacterium]|jgi:aerotaxis receptor|nr:PAS domain-containing protein [Helicobacteraceae bacterium]
MAEVILNDDAFLVSQTDDQGVITFANGDFVKISGYSLGELVGQPHNIVRHPDMPKAAFKTLWDTIQGGRTWTGFVKNRTKNDDFYWVYATIMEASNIDGSKCYISARRKATRSEIAEAETLYATLR